MARSLTVPAMASLPISPPLEEERRDGKAVGGKGDGAAYRQQGGIFTAQQDLVAKVAKEELVDQLVHFYTAAAVA